MNKKDRMMAIMKYLDVNGRSKISSIKCKLNLGSCMMTNASVRLKEVGLITSDEKRRGQSIWLTARGHAALFNEFANNEYLYPHSKRGGRKAVVPSTDDSKSLELHILFNKLTKQRVPSWDY